MRIGWLVVLLAFAAVALQARADAYVYGTASTSAVGGNSCNNSGVGGAGCSSTGSESTANAFDSGSGSNFSGSMSAYAEVNGNSFGGTAVASITLTVGGLYVLTGGTGMGTVDFYFDASFLDTPMTCIFTFNGVSTPPTGTDSCVGVGIISETVEYDVPFMVGINMSVYASAGGGEPNEGTQSYGISGPGLELASQLNQTPEPSSILLLMPGMFGVLVAGRSRMSAKKSGPQ